MIFGVTVIIVLGHHKPHTCNMANSNDKSSVFWLYYLVFPPSFSFFSGLPIPWHTTRLKSGQLIILEWPHCSSERKSCISVTLNQKLEMIKLSEEGMSKAEIGWKLRPLASVSQVTDAKEKCLKEVKSAAPVNVQMKVRQLYCWYGASRSGLDRRSNQPQHSFS